MLYATAGTQLFIADAPAEQSGAFPSFGWIEIKETEALGVLGAHWSLAETAVPQCDGQLEVEFVKDTLRRANMEIILGNDPTDPGQALLWAASRSTNSFPFRLCFPDGSTTRQWFALVVGLTEVFDAANSVIKLQANLQPTSYIFRSEAP